MSEAQYMHKGVEILFNATTGEFSAKVGDKFKRFASLASAKSAIDKQQADTFEAFDILDERRYGDPEGPDVPFIVRRVVRIEKGRGKRTWSNADRFVTADGKTHREVVLDTPENRAAWMAAYTYRQETKRMREERQEHQEKLDEAIARIAPPK